MWHYRNSGGDLGRVLVGLSVPLPDRAKMYEMLDGLGYQWSDETNNPAYSKFLLGEGRV